MMDPHRRAAHADYVDGNVLAGALERLFGGEPTEMIAVCGACGSAAPIAEAWVEIDGAVAIVRCRSCTKTLATVMTGEDPPRMTFSALAELRAT
ncbi:DUF6510 family protein [Microbacterium sp.]|jgi:hypothetical protein|uniref:DUF6510 family protein n=1 Tax=Microbacterium sp. TaxID=51671 RepID=UPI0037C5DAAD